MGRKKRKADKKTDKAGNVRPLNQKNASASAVAQSSGNVMGWVARAQSFLKEVRIEFDKTTWSSKKETMAMTAAVLALTFFFTAYLGLVDMSLSKLVGFLIY